MSAPSLAPTLDPNAAHGPGQVPAFGEALRFWWKLGWISFGGPAGQIAILHQELVERKGWISEASFLHALNYCMLLPGPEAQQMATYLGWLMHRTRGGVAAGVLFVAPSLLILIGLSWVYLAWGHLSAIRGVFDGIQPVVAAIVLQAIHRMSQKALKTRLAWALAGGAFGASYVLDWPFPAIVAMAGAVGWLAARPTGGPTTVPGTAATSAVSPHTPTERPAHTRFSRQRLVQVCAVFAALWAVPLVWLVLQFGWQHTLTQMGWFFTKVALLTFGGAYAVLPYVLDGAVHHYGWLTAAQMLDGLAFGETTPGPLIMVVAFVGFLGGHGQAVLGPDHLWVGAVLAATLVTWFTFLPSFFFILAGGPAVEQTQHQPRLVGALAGVSAAVMGAMLQMALFFAAHVLWPSAQSGFDGVAALWMLAAAAALIVWKRPVMQVIAAGALLGLLQTLLFPR